MSELLNYLERNADMNQDDVDKIYKRWEDIGFLEGISPTQDKRRLALQMEKYAQILIKNPNENVETVIFPIIRRLYSIRPYDFEILVDSVYDALSVILECFYSYREHFNNFNYIRIDAECEFMAELCEFIGNNMGNPPNNLSDQKDIIKTIMLPLFGQPRTTDEFKASCNIVCFMIFSGQLNNADSINWNDYVNEWIIFKDGPIKSKVINQLEVLFPHINSEQMLNQSFINNYLQKFSQLKKKNKGEIL